jgi:hypothetical protein
MGSLELLSIKTKYLAFDTNNKKFSSCKKRDEKKLCFYSDVIQRFDFLKFYGRHSISTFTIDRTMIETVRKYLWICIMVDSGWKTVLGIYNSEENHFEAANFI